MNTVLNTIRHYSRAFTYIKAIEGRRYFLFSGIIGVIIFVVLSWVIKSNCSLLTDMLSRFVTIDIAWLRGVANLFSGALMTLFFLIVYKYLVLICTAPLMSRLSAELEMHHSGIPTASDGFVSDLIRGIRISVRNIFRELGLSLIILVISFFPMIGIISSPMIFLIQGFYAGFGNFDYWAERHLTYRGTVDYMRDHKIMLTSHGMIFVLLLAIPIVGAIIGPPLATAASTMHALEKGYDR